MSIDIPILPDVTQKLKEFATKLENFSIYEYERSQAHWHREPNPKDLLHYEESPLCSTLKVLRDPFTGKISGFREVPNEAAGATAQNSMLLNRAPLPISESARGNALFIPFLPGSFIDEELKIPEHTAIPNKELLTIPPGFSSGVTFDADGSTVIDDDKVNSVTNEIQKQSTIVNLLDLVEKEKEYLGSWCTTEQLEPEDVQPQIPQDNEAEEEILPKEPLVLKISEVTSTKPAIGTEYAVLLDASKPVDDFKEKVPKMACEFDFPTLDPFQQLAIIQLEKHNHVFVAAHTSSGKTAVAEYAIALSQQHLTKTIYTSPIKALSNQKYRDFKNKFEDVGLITGDVQINPTASCLIMTTEILRSMLYCGSDVVRDLEYVIFDEVHYINDRERGHVWEQSLILLPEHVCVVLLSATVPKPEEFADWLGRTHKKKVYVITTPFRPVPLQHFLYTGVDNKTRKNQFKVLDATKWCMEGYIQAKNSFMDQRDKKGGDRRQYTQFTEKQDKNLWGGLITHLKEKNLLPAVAFTFSRAKCDKNAANLLTLPVSDMTTDGEKYTINTFYERCIKCLKENDRKIPQVQHMREILRRGIGVHHSGVLPIIKEIVEMLFQEGLIKLLFATETFAMGVNMPARTVIFDSVTKHDGKEWRDLEAAEYIQMAGRAGRRKFDKTGTVIILCKNFLPSEISLKQMLTGKPQTLKSQFRLTYGMVLSLLRVETLTVEGMISRSFLEVDYQRKLIDRKKELVEVEKKIAEMQQKDFGSYLQPLVEYFDAANRYLSFRKETLKNIFASSKIVKVMTPGRILLISWKNRVNRLALLLSVSKLNQQYKVLILDDLTVPNCGSDEKTDLWYKIISLAFNDVYQPIDTLGHNVIDITSLDVLEITGKCLKIDTSLILKDWNNRQIERFKLDPPGQTTVKAIEELRKLSTQDSRRDYLHFSEDLHIADMNLLLEVNELYRLKHKLYDHLASTQIPNFEQQFSDVFARKYLEERREYLKELISKDSLTLYPDYQNRIELLKKLEYVNSNNIVQLKGRVACQMGMNELLITELILRNLLEYLKPAEVAALLSTLVFQVKSRNKESEEEIMKEVTPPLRKAMEKLKEIHQGIVNLEASLDIRSEDIQEELNFGVVTIVYEWASQMSFAEIMEHTDYQEGIIVRCIQQLNETVCDVRDAAKIIGNPALHSKMDETSKAIKRDIAFAGSLYTQEDDVAIRKLKKSGVVNKLKTTMAKQDND